MIKMGTSFDKLVTRTLSGAVLVALVVAATLLSKWSLGVMMGCFMLGCLFEFYRLSSRCGINAQKAVGCAAALALYGLGFTVFYNYGTGVGYTEGTLAAGLLMYLLLIIPAAFACELWRKQENPIANIAATLCGVIYVAVPFTLILFLPLMMGVKGWNPYMMLLYIALVWMNDIFAYLTGIFFGRHKICERISPKKTWEGFAGGVAMSMLTAMVAAHVLGLNMWVYAGLGAVTAVTAVMGDYTESMFKRAADVKDSGAIMPGHGGFLDRFDATIMTVPFVFVYLMLVQDIL